MMECSSIQYLMSHTRRRRAAGGGALVTSHQAHSCNHRGSRTRNPFLIPAPARPSPPQPRAGTSCKSHPNLAWNNIKYRIENICWAAPRRGRQWSVARASRGHVSLDNSINCTGWSSIHGICTQGLFSISTYSSSACGLSPNSPSQREKFLSESFIIKSLYLSLSTYLSIYCHVFYNLGICRYRTYPKCSLMRPPPSLSPCIWMLSWGGHLHTAAMENIVISHVISNVTLVIANPIIVIGSHYSISTDWGSSNVSTYTSYSDPQTWLGRNNIIIHNITHYTWTLHNTNLHQQLGSYLIKSASHSH